MLKRIFSSSRLSKRSRKDFVNIKDLLKDTLKFFHTNTHLNTTYVNSGKAIITYGLVLERYDSKPLFILCKTRNSSKEEYLLSCLNVLTMIKLNTSWSSFIKENT